MALGDLTGELTIMPNTETDFRCLHCNATPSDNEIDSGWCDSCGKRLPNAAPTKSKEPDWLSKARAEADAGNRTGRNLLAVVAVLAVGIATAAAGIFLGS
jgi:hypothetical protein